MSGAAWAAAAVICMHLNSLGALPPEVQAQTVAPYLSGQQAIRVLIASDASALTLRPRRAAALEEQRGGKRLAVVQAGAAITVRPAKGGLAVSGPGLKLSGSSVVVRPVSADEGVLLSPRGGSGRRGLYPGRLEITAIGRGLRVVEEVDLETYVAGVVASEMPSHFPLEAMKAQAIAARTYALYHLGGHEVEQADICGGVHCQAYAGRPALNSAAARAARATAGQVLLWNGLLIDSMYHAACGGNGATAWEVRQGKLLPYLRGQADAPSGGWGESYCSRDHQVEWSRRVSFQDAARLVSANLGAVTGSPGLAPGKLQDMRLVKSEESGRAEWLMVETGKGSYRVRGDAVRWLFGRGRAGPKGLRSSAFDLLVKRDGAGRPVAFEFEGRGHGHGIGLCQWGARGRARAGQTAEEMLADYYPGAMLADLQE